MAQVNEQKAPSVDVRDTVPDNLQHLRASPNTFGAAEGAGLQAVGQGGLQAVDYFSQVQTDDALTGAMQNAGKVLEHFTSLKGRDALDAQKDTQAQLDQIYNTGKGSLTFGRQQHAFDQTFRTFRQRYIEGQIKSHANQQGDILTYATNAALRDTGLKMISTDPDNPETIKAGHDIYMKGVIQDLQHKGQANDPDIFAATMADAKNTILETSIKALAPTNPTRAMELLNANRADLQTTKNYGELENYVTSKVTLPYEAAAAGDLNGAYTAWQRDRDKFPAGAQVRGDAFFTPKIKNEQARGGAADLLSEVDRNYSEGQKPQGSITIDESVNGSSEGNFASESGGNGVRGEGYMTPAEVAAGGKQTVKQSYGGISTEKTIHFESDGKFYVIPSIINGESYTFDAAEQMFKDGKIKPLGIFDTANHAETFARQRSADLDAAFSGGSGVLRRGPSSPASGGLRGTITEAILAQESGGKSPPFVSVDGAVGKYQITPDTFRRYARPGEDINKPADNEAVGQRILGDLQQKFPNDPARVAVAYFSGEGNVAPAGSATPWIADKADGNGKTVSSYVGDIQKRMQNGAGPGNPTGGLVQTQADYYEAHEAQILDMARKKADAAFPDDPAFADSMVARVQQRMGQVIGQQQARQRADNSLVIQAFNGQLSKGVRPKSMEELSGISPEVGASLDRLQVENPLAWRNINDRILTANAKESPQDLKTYGSGFYSLFNRVHAAPGTEGRITDPAELYGHVGGDLTVSGLEKLTSEINGRGTAEGTAEGEMKKVFFANAKAQISGSNEGLHIKDPKGDELFLKFMARALPAYDKGHKDGKTPSELLDPDSPDYIGKTISNFKRPMSQWNSDMTLGDAQSTDQNVGIKPPDISTQDGLILAVQNGQISREDGENIAVKNGWIQAKPSVPIK